MKRDGQGDQLKTNGYSRRAFLRKLAFGGGQTSALSEKTLVCVFLRGGADTLNMFIPCADDDYYKMRPNIAIKAPSKGGADSAIKLDDIYALHPKMAPLLPLYKEGRLGVVQGVGTDNPYGSHFAAQDQIEHGEACGHNLGGGWLGRHLASRGDDKQTPLSAVAIGTALPESMRGAPAASVLTNIDEVKLQSPGGDTLRAARALAALYKTEVALLAKPGKTTLDLLARVEKMQSSPYKVSNTAEYPADSFGQGLKEIARMIKGKVGLEVAALDLGGWDTHFFQGGADGLQAGNIDVLARGLAAFDTDLGTACDTVTTLVITEFGRRNYENSSMGTDHGRGFAVMAIGDRINGGRVHGTLPSLKHGQEYDLLGPSGLQINYDYRSVLAEILLRSMDNHRLDLVFPGFDTAEIGLVKRSVV
ncbi:MAG: DUF1501 domain-containing protein [Cyanobacteria bacterium REEB67]|nr:DUF1501 domain-containing protein [Cyanobacteria bacterium REEB67]